VFRGPYLFLGIGLLWQFSGSGILGFRIFSAYENSRMRYNMPSPPRTRAQKMRVFFCYGVSYAFF
jgi:hypothetical protein